MDKYQKRGMREKYIITDALPYANGPIHIGHIAGVHLPADIYTRFLRKKGHEVIHISGTDEHGVPITISAEEQGITPRQLVDYYHNMIKKALEDFGIEFENFSRTTRRVHHKLSQDMFNKLRNNGYIEKRVSREFYCPNCERFLPDRYVEGTCPYCGYKEARGDSCDSCGSWLEPEKLIDPRCKLCGATPVMKETKHWYLLLDRFQKRLEKWLERKDWKVTVKKYLEGWLDEGLRPRSITRDLKWGIEVPLENEKGKVLYVWFEAPIGYISATIEWAERIGEPEKWREFWQDKETRLIHFIGKDNIVFHGLIWPATLMGYGDYILPDEIPANEFLNLEGRQISTSRNWAVWLHEYLKCFEPDFLRYYLSIIMPETKDSDFKWEEFQERVNTELINNLGNFVNRTLRFVEEYTDGKIPEAGFLEERDRFVINKINKLISRIDNALTKFQFRRAIRAWMEISTLGNRYYDMMKPWIDRKENKERMATTIHICSHIIHILSSIGELFIPFGAEKIYSMLNLKGKDWHRLKEMDIPPEHPIGKVEPLYQKVADEEIRKQIRRLKVPYIDIEDFQGMGLKVGIITGVEGISGADTLYKLTVNTGEARTLVAGLKEHYTEDELMGKSIVVITNLKPATIMGVQSDGMLLAATEGETVSIISPDQEVSAGALIS